MKTQSLSSCKLDFKTLRAGPFVLVLFGGTGELSLNKLLPALFKLFSEKLLKNFSILSLGRRPFSLENYQTFVKKSIQKNLPGKINADTLQNFLKKIHYQIFNIKNEIDYGILCRSIQKLSQKDETENVIYYLAISPSLYFEVIAYLSKNKLCKEKPHTKIVVEKPFGHDEKSAKQLNQILLSAFDEHQIYRIDHYLGKETVQNILFFRFANSIFEPLWNRNYIDHIQITVSETIGIQNRGAFYEEAGVIRDMVQNHILQVIAMITMEAPVGFESNLVRDEKVKIFEAIRPMDSRYIQKNIIVAQYDKGKIARKNIKAYRDEENVAKNSVTPTYFEGTFYIDNWRWADVPIHVKTGKRLAKRSTQIVIDFKMPPLKLLKDACSFLEPNTLIITIQPEEEIALAFCVKYPGPENRPYPVHMRFNYQEAFKIKTFSAYERLILDCIKSDASLFARQDEIELMWRIVDPITRYLERKPHREILLYSAGSEGV
ncbi:MAG: glucose-6-phosphate dehydrogenase [Gammaproteobacteria bacterium]|nr:glucose-6-phosphate dehydrogenase [Gammaproteobacteria bacterium]